jgi:hypothetical protein
MRYFIPDLRLAEELPPQTALQDKLGGLPWGLRAELWPTCRDCEKSQSLLAQLVHDPVRLDLGRAGRVLSIFQCNHNPGECLTYQGGSGANASFIIEPEDLFPGLAALPEDAPKIEREARIVEWLEKDDGITESEAALFWSRKTLLTLPAEIVEPPQLTKLGSVPAWVQNPEDAPKGDWRFLGQLSMIYHFLQPPAINAADICEDTKRYEGHSHYCEGPDFGDLGIGYIFMRAGAEPPECWFFWQCS